MNYYIKTTDEAALWEALESADLAKKEYDRDHPIQIFRLSTLWPKTCLIKIKSSKKHVKFTNMMKI
jgi:hypothetical protein